MTIDAFIDAMKERDQAAERDEVEELVAEEIAKIEEGFVSPSGQRIRVRVVDWHLAPPDSDGPH